MKRILVAIASAVAALSLSVISPAPADAGTWWATRCYHGNVGPTEGGDFWQFMGEVGTGHRYDHYKRYPWSNLWYLHHTDYTTGCH